MPYSLNLEELENRWIAHVAELPGAFAGGATVAAAVEAAPAAILDYLVWSEAPASVPLSPEAEVREIVRAWNYTPDYEVNAFFASDRPALTAEDVEAARRLLYLAQAELLDAFLGVEPRELDQRLPGEERSINDILRHVGSGENWYLSHFDMAHPAAWDMDDPLGRQLLARQQLLEALPLLAGDERVLMVSGELWSPRKIVRRALWHQREHAAQVRGLRAQIREARHA